MNRWSLPGPAGFLEQVFEAVRAGSNMVIAAPSAVVQPLAYELEDRLAEEWRVTGPLIARAGKKPIDELYDLLELPGGQSIRRSVASFMSALDRKRLVFVLGVGARNWPEWRRFVEDYASASRAVGAMDRTQILLFTDGIGKSQLPTEAPALAPLVWDGHVGEADVFSYIMAAWRRRGRRIDGECKVLARTITNLALWDFDLVDALIELDPHDLFDPAEAIRMIVSRQDTWANIGPSWEQGGAADFDGRPCTHAVVVFNGGDRESELSMRVWAAQAAELLPALELKRRELAKRMRDARLPLPATLNGERIHDAADIEIGPLLHLARVNRMPPHIVRAAEKYAGLRNKLAHLTPLTAAEALDPDVLQVRVR